MTLTEFLRIFWRTQKQQGSPLVLGTHLESGLTPLTAVNAETDVNHAARNVVGGQELLHEFGFPAGCCCL